MFELYDAVQTRNNSTVKTTDASAIEMYLGVVNRMRLEPFSAHDKSMAEDDGKSVCESRFSPDSLNMCGKFLDCRTCCVSIRSQSRACRLFYNAMIDKDSEENKHFVVWTGSFFNVYFHLQQNVNTAAYVYKAKTVATKGGALVVTCFSKSILVLSFRITLINTHSERHPLQIPDVCLVFKKCAQYLISR